MYLMYVDESGDPGVISGNNSKHYILSGIIVSQTEWKIYLDRLKEFRKYLSKTYSFNVKLEIHASELIRINKTKEYRKFHKNVRIAILRDFCNQIPVIFDGAKVINICIDKSQYTSSKEIQITAWERLVQRFDTYLKKSAKDSGIIISDDTDGNAIIKSIRKMRVYNPVPSSYGKPRNLPTTNIIEDLFQRSSDSSYFIQSSDVIAHLLYRKEYPKGSLKKYGLSNLFNKIQPILLLEASRSDALGIVRK